LDNKSSKISKQTKKRNFKRISCKRNKRY